METSHKRMLWMRHHRFWLFAAIILLLVGASLGLLLTFGANVKGPKTQYIYIKQGMTYADVVDSLRATGSVNNLRAFDLLAKISGYPDSIRLGRYALRPGMSNYRLIRTLGGGHQAPISFRVPSRWTLEAIAQEMAQPLRLEEQALKRLFEDTTYWDSLGIRFDQRQRFFIANTYEVYWTVSARGLIERMLHEHQAFWTDKRKQLANEIGLSPQKAGILASIVERESKMVDEQPRIAGVYINRLRRGQRLQADPTVKYAVGDFGLRRILKRHLFTDSPYNTYRHDGLPPGPICNPSVSALKAVLNFERHDYYYFVAKNDFSGYHIFSKTYREHKKKASEYHQRLNEMNIK